MIARDHRLVVAVPVVAELRTCLVVGAVEFDHDAAVAPQQVDARPLDAGIRHELVAAEQRPELGVAIERRPDAPLRVARAVRRPGRGDEPLRRGFGLGEQRPDVVEQAVVGRLPRLSV